MKKRFVVRKYVMADTAAQALRLENKVKPDEVFIDDEWYKQNVHNITNIKGFKK